MLKTYQFKTQCKGDIHSSKTANIILPGLVTAYRWTPLRVVLMRSVFWHCWLDDRKDIQSVKTPSVDKLMVVTSLHVLRIPSSSSSSSVFIMTTDKTPPPLPLSRAESKIQHGLMIWSYRLSPVVMETSHWNVSFVVVIVVVVCRIDNFLVAGGRRGRGRRRRRDRGGRHRPDEIGNIGELRERRQPRYGHRGQ